MEQMILLLFLSIFLSITNVLAHMPVFGKDLETLDTQSKSWGVYILLDKNYSLTMNVPSGKNISFSLSVPGRNKEQPNITVMLSGHGATNISCDSEFNGWGTKAEWSFRRLSGSGEGHEDDSTQQIIVRKTNQIVFEPFGVGAYRPIAACQGKSDVGGIFKLTITNRMQKKVPITIGVGTVESFGFQDYLFMSFAISQSWLWADQSLLWEDQLLLDKSWLWTGQLWLWTEQLWSLYIPITGMVLYLIIIIPNNKDNKGCIKKRKLYQKLGWLCGWFMVVSSLQFIIRLIYISTLEVHTDKLWFPLIFHIISPLVVCVLFGLYTKINLQDANTCAYIKYFFVGFLFIAYTFALLWQSYCFALVGFIGYFWGKLFCGDSKSNKDNIV